MTIHRLQYLIAQREIKSNPEALCLFDEITRSNKKVVTYATNLDRYSIRFAAEKILSDHSYVFQTQGKNPKKLEDLLMRFPELETPKLRSIVDVYHNPLDFTEFPDEYYRDFRFINSCKTSIAYKVKEVLYSNKQASENDLRWAKDIEALVNETIALHNLTYKSRANNYKLNQPKNAIVLEIKKPVHAAKGKTK